MARPIRIEVPGALYHVIARGNERKAIFRDDLDRNHYLQRLVHYRGKFNFRLLAYCLMDNHVHLAVETGKAPLSRIMAGLQSSYTQYFNRRHGRVGHLFQGRYKAFLVEKDRYALALLRYIHENPVKAGVVRRANQYAWSSDRHYRAARGPEWMDSDRLLAMLGQGRAAALSGYRRLMLEEVQDPYEKARSWGQVVKGDESFAGHAYESAGDVLPIRRDLTLDAVIRLVSDAEGIDPKWLQRGRAHRESRARLMIAWAGREVAGISLARTAKRFRRDSSTVARGVSRLEQRMRGDRELRRRLEQVAKRLRKRPRAKNTTIQD